MDAEFRTRIPGSNFLILFFFFQQKRPPEKFTLEKFTSQNSPSKIWGRGSGGVKSAAVSQSVRETDRDESQSVPSPEKLFKTRDLELPIFEGSLPSGSPHSAGCTRTSVHPHFPVAKKFNPEIRPKNSHCTSAGPFG